MCILTATCQSQFSNVIEVSVVPSNFKISQYYFRFELFRVWFVCFIESVPEPIILFAIRLTVAALLNL